MKFVAYLFSIILIVVAIIYHGAGQLDCRAFSVMRWA